MAGMRLRCSRRQKALGALLHLLALTPWHLQLLADALPLRSCLVWGRKALTLGLTVGAEAALTSPGTVQVSTPPQRVQLLLKRSNRAMPEHHLNCTLAPD